MSNTSPTSCGTSCTPCVAPTGGAAACSAGQCSATCPTGKKICTGTCIDMLASCMGGDCPPGTHDCAGSCAANTSVNSCGTSSCVSCPRPAGSLAATCSGTSCDFTCAAGYHRCGARCLADDDPAGCGAACSVCPTDPNGAPTCASGSCGLRCNTSFHPCLGRCVSNSAPATCGPTSCDPCVAPTGGTVSCSGLACVSGCPTGKKLCGGACIDNALACNGACQTAGTHNCSGVCLSNTSPASCGARCTACPDPPSHGMASCTAAGSCGITCETGYKNCPGTALCILEAGCCTSAQCTSGGTGTVGTCTAANTCTYACNSATHKPCGSTCIPNGSCCNSASMDCPATSPICNTTTHMCEKRANGAACTTQSECASASGCLTCYQDGDRDGSGNKWAAPTGMFCGVCPAGSINNRFDCQDANAGVNPGAAFSADPYATDPNDTSPDEWDWNCDDNRTLETPAPMTVTIPTGCTATSNCSTGCVTASMNVVPNQGCGEFTGGAGCANVCSGPPASCISAQTSTYRQLCR